MVKWLLVFPVVAGGAIYLGGIALAVAAVMALLYLLFNVYFGGIGKLLKDKPILQDPVWGRVLAYASAAILIAGLVIGIQLIVTH
ncbi:hypothetical protein [Nocardia xishanensis]|uniref:hypothetical protein n=1 Tax=Nocardia xishanensis TaxID=238964 RepID=UPI0034496859